MVLGSSWKFLGGLVVVTSLAFSCTSVTTVGGGLCDVDSRKDCFGADRCVGEMTCDAQGQWSACACPSGAATGGSGGASSVSKETAGAGGRGAGAVSISGGSGSGGRSFGGGASGGGTVSAAGGAAPSNSLSLFTFSKDLEGFSSLDYSTTLGAGCSTLSAGAGGSSQETQTRCRNLKVSWASGEGYGGNPGALSLEAPFSAYGQIVVVEHNFDAPLNWSGRALTVRIKVQSGLNPSSIAPGGAYLSVKSGEGYAYASGLWQNLGPEVLGSWMELHLDLDHPEGSPQVPEGYDPRDIRVVAVEISSGVSALSVPQLPSPAKILIDEFALTPH